MKDSEQESKPVEKNTVRLEVNIDAYDSSAVSSKGLVYVGDRLLVYRRGPEAPTHPLYLDIPGGRTENGETPFETWQREVKEEFGLDIPRESIVWARKYELPDKPWQPAYFSVSRLPSTFFNNIKFGNEGIEWMLMSPADFVSKDDVHRPFITRTLEYLNSSVDEQR